MALEDTVKEAGKAYGELQAIAEDYRRNPVALFDSSLRLRLGNIAHRINPADDEHALIGVSADVAHQYANQYLAQAKNSLNDVVNGHYGEVLKMIKRDKLIDLVLGSEPAEELAKKYGSLKEKVEIYQKLVDALEKKNPDSYIKMAKGKHAQAAMRYRAEADPERMLKSMAHYVHQLEGEIRKELKDKPDEFLMGYLMKSYDSSTDEAKKEMNVLAGQLASHK